MMYKVSINGDCMEFKFERLNAVLTYIRAVAKSNDISDIYISKVTVDYKMPEMEEINKAIEEL